MLTPTHTHTHTTTTTTTTTNTTTVVYINYRSNTVLPNFVCMVSASVLYLVCVCADSHKSLYERYHLLGTSCTEGLPYVLCMICLFVISVICQKRILVLIVTIPCHYLPCTLHVYVAIMLTSPYNVDPCKPHFYVVKIYTYIPIFALNLRLWVLVGSASLRQY